MWRRIHCQLQSTLLSDCVIHVDCRRPTLGSSRAPVYTDMYKYLPVSVDSNHLPQSQRTELHLVICASGIKLKILLQAAWYIPCDCAGFAANRSGNRNGNTSLRAIVRWLSRDAAVTCTLFKLHPHSLRMQLYIISLASRNIPTRWKCVWLAEVCLACASRITTLPYSKMLGWCLTGLHAAMK